MRRKLGRGVYIMDYRAASDSAPYHGSFMGSLHTVYEYQGIQVREVLIFTLKTYTYPYVISRTDTARAGNPQDGHLF